VSRYRALFIGFMLATLFAIGWLFLAAGDFIMAGFNCADRTSEWEACARPIQFGIALKSAAVVGLWVVGLWLLIRERKKQ
jgi:hypothetical protein